MTHKIAVIGLGYVGLPVAVAFAQKFSVIGFDINPKRLEALRNGWDQTGEISSSQLASSPLYLTDCVEKLREANFYIITVPTPIDAANRPDLKFLLQASETIGSVLKKGDIVVYESTVFPGATEEICIPLLEKKSGLKNGTDFNVGYSPERINPGDKNHSFTKICKIISAQTEDICTQISNVYQEVVREIYPVHTIKVAEAAKVIENTQRDLNIAFMNELAILFHKLGIDTQEVLKAAQTKWNFLPFFPGLVGGHCIGVDPYYLTFKAEEVGYHPQMILAGRRVNDSMGEYIALQALREMIHLGLSPHSVSVNVLGLSFKEDCPDLRNTKVMDIIKTLGTFNIFPRVADPVADPEDALNQYAISLVPLEDLPPADITIVAVAHTLFKDWTEKKWSKLIKSGGGILDVKGIISPSLAHSLGSRLWRL